MNSCKNDDKIAFMCPKCGKTYDYSQMMFWNECPTCNSGRPWSDTTVEVTFSSSCTETATDNGEKEVHDTTSDEVVPILFISAVSLLTVSMYIITFFYKKLFVIAMLSIILLIIERMMYEHKNRTRG